MFSHRIQIMVYVGTTVSVVTYAAVTTCLRSRDEEKLKRFVRKTLRITWYKKSRGTIQESHPYRNTLNIKG